MIITISLCVFIDLIIILLLSLCVFNSNFYNLMHKNHNIHYKLITLHMIVYQSKPVWCSLTQLLFCHKSLRCVAEFHHVLILKLVWTIAFILHHWFFVQLFIFQIMAWSFLGLDSWKLCDSWAVASHYVPDILQPASRAGTIQQLQMKHYVEEHRPLLTVPQACNPTLPPKDRNLHLCMFSLTWKPMIEW